MGITNDLERLAELHRSGALSDAEFASAKAHALGSTPSAGEDRVMHGLHALRRSRADRWLGGVCGGLAPVTGLPAWLWRLTFLLLALCGGTGLVLYVLLWILLPKEDPGLDRGAGSFRSTGTTS
jgi:phage shock protein PspC (stress-responsive transcriptional regulator)